MKRSKQAQQAQKRLEQKKTRRPTRSKYEIKKRARLRTQAGYVDICFMRRVCVGIIAACLLSIAYIFAQIGGG